MSRIEGVQLLAYPRHVVSQRLSDAEFIVNSLNRVDEILEVGPDQSVWKTRLGMGVISSTIQVTLTVVERLGNQTKYLAVTSGGGGTGRSEILLSFDEHENGTHVTYQADILERTGLLKIVSISLIRSAAQTVIEETWQSINARLK